MATSQRSSTLHAPDRFSRLFGLAGRGRPRSDRRQTARNRMLFSLEAMEERALMSNIPVLTTVNAPASTPTVVQLAPMEETVVNGNFVQWQYWNEEVQANLTAGELYVVSEDVQATAPRANSRATRHQGFSSTRQMGPGSRTATRFQRPLPIRSPAS